MIHLKRLLLILLVVALARPVTYGQLRQEPMSSTDILAALEKLQVLGSVLYFAAHPDDENTRFIAWSAKEMHYRTAYLSLTRGDGGQNLIGTELAEELGLIRTQELLAARQVDGGEQYFSRANDFGFSKTPEETLEFWGKEAILADAVWVIRQLKPDVIITRFPPDPRGGHGHHQAATILAMEAFEAAADPTKFPEQLAHVDVWQAKRLLWNTANFGGQNNTSPSQFQIDIGQYDVLSGQSYGEIAAESRSKHQSQGFGAARQRGSVWEYFETLDGEDPIQSLMDGVDVTWTRVPGAQHIPALIEHIMQHFDVRQPERSVPALIDLLKALEQLDENYWTPLKIEEVTDIILACIGFWAESYAQAPKIALGDEVRIRTDLIVRRPLHGVQVALAVEDARPHWQTLPYNSLVSIDHSVLASKTSQPYWLREPKTDQRFTVDDLMEIGQAVNPDDLQVSIRVLIDDAELLIERPVVFKYTHPVHGEIHQPLAISPVVTAHMNAQALVFTPGSEKTLDVTFMHHGDQPLNVEAAVQVPAGWLVSPATISLNFTQKDQELNQRLTILAPANATGLNPDSTEVLRWQIRPENGQHEAAYMYRTIDYQHIPMITYFPPAEVRLSMVETGVSSTRIGYLAGAGDLVPDALRQVGLQVDLLTVQDIIDQDISQYDAIVSGIRAYNVLPRIGVIYEKLMDYVHQGGTYLMQYNVSSRLASQDFGPYPFKISRLRVTDETAPVRFLDPDHRILNYPNKIQQADFDGWVQERGLYFPIDVDPAYDTPLSMNDSGEQALDGAVIIGSYGKGKFVYTSLAFFRQLPTGVPGAYRLFINLIAHD